MGVPNPMEDNRQPMVTWLDDERQALPPTHCARPDGSELAGLLAAGGRLTPQRLHEAYSNGVFPWFGENQPVLWWTPDPRMVLPVAEFRLSRSLRKAVRRFAEAPSCELRIDGAFDEVIAACAAMPREGQAGTWIVAEMVEAYRHWHRLGRVHSVEAWIDGELAGGLYGVSIGRMFFGESMFARRTDASKIALAGLVCFAREHGIELIDCQQRTGHLASLGARELPRAEFEQRLRAAAALPDIGEWSYDRSLWRHLAGRAAPVRDEEVTG